MGYANDTQVNTKDIPAKTVSSIKLLAFKRTTPFGNK